ncbi:MAG TPA: ADOP family duplicated permease [Candidatus Eisenbacteria bacterium]|jgi:predicted permease
MPSVGHELRFAARSLRHSPLASGFIVATLAICIGAVATVYSVADVVLIHSLPFDHPERLIWVSSVRRDRPDAPFTLPELLDYRAQATSVRLGGYANWSAIFEGRSGAQWVQGLRVSADGLALLGARASVGRLLTGADDAPDAPRVVMLGHGYWRRAFAGDQGIIGRSLRLNGESYTVVGVLPRFFPLPVRDVDLVVPLDPERDPRRNARGSVNFIRMFGRLEPSATAAGADRELNLVAARLRAQFPVDYARKLGVRATPLQDYLATTLRPTLIVLLACVSLMVVIALVNVLNLLLARAVRRQGETAVCLALGASHARLALRFLIEGALLVATAGLIGSGLAYLAISYAASHLGAIAPRIEEARLSPTVLGLVFAVCAIAVLLFSLAPILIARSASLETVLRGVGRAGGTTRTQARLRSSFIVVEVALALIVTSATAALVQSLIGLERVELGYRPDSVFVARLSLPPKRYPTPADLSPFSLSMSAALAGAPGVVAAGGTSNAPLSGVLASVPVAPAQDPPALRSDWPNATYRAVSAGYLEAIGAHRRAGRLISEHDDGAAPTVAVVNRALAERFFAKTGAVDRQLLIDDNDTGPRPVTIVGVVDDLRETDLDGPAAPEVFISMRQVHPDATSLVTATQFWAVRVRSEPAAFGPTFLRILHEVDPAVATGTLTDLRAYVDTTIAPRRFSVGLLVTFTLISLLLTALGVYGIAAYTVEQRRHEIGIRMALGASPRSIVGLIFARTIRLAGIGTAAGAFGAWLASGFMSRLMFGVSPGSPALLALVSAGLLVTAMVASGVPAVGAVRADALRGLRAE